MKGGGGGGGVGGGGGGKRRWKVLVIGVLVLVILSMLVPLAFLLGLHNGFHSPGISISFLLSHSLSLRSLVSDLSNISSFSSLCFRICHCSTGFSCEHSFPFFVVFMRRVMVDVLILF